MQFNIRLIRLGRVQRHGACVADNQAQAEREVNEGIDPLSGDWVDIRAMQEDSHERAEVIREAVETMKHPENVGAG